MKFLKHTGTMVLASSLLLTAAPMGAWANEIASSGTVAASPASTGASKETALDASITKEQALEKAKTYLTLPEGFTFQSISLNANYGMNGQRVPTWNINYNKQVSDRYYGYANIAINGLDGSLSSFSMNDNDPEHKPSYPPKVDFAAAKELAAAFIAKVNPEKGKELLYDESLEKAFRTPLDGNYQYAIRYDRSVNGLPFSGNGISVNVNGDGRIVSYTYNWDDKVKFDQASKPISKEKAEQLFHEKANLSLQYQMPYNRKGNLTPFITYTMYGFALDAATGEIWNETPILGAGNKPLTEKPLGTQPPATMNLTKEEAVKKISTAFNLSSDYKLQDVSYNESTNPETGKTFAGWSMSWNKSGTGTASDAKMIPGGGSAWANINSKTGEIMNFNSYEPYISDMSKPIEGKVSLDTAISTSTDFVKAQLPGYTNQLVLSVQKEYPEDVLKNMRNWEISFMRVIDGVTVINEQVHVSIDRVTGAIVNYSANLSDTAYPVKKPDVLSEDKAKALWLAQFDVKLGYVLGGNGYLGTLPIEKYRVMMAAGDLPKSALNENGEIKAKLVYSLIPKNTYRDSFFLDALTGQWRSAQSGEVISLDKVTVSDIEGHWGQNELQLMLDYQALDVKDGKVNPDEKIKRGELVKMLVIAMNGGNGGIYYGAERPASFADVAKTSAYFAYVENAVDRGLLQVGKDFNPEATMDREEMAQLIVKALSYGKLAKYDGVFNKDFADAGKLAHVGDAAIVVGLNIMSLTDGYFAPQEEVTKAQAASAFYRFLERRAELQEQPRYY
ncbi:YcdB/YcdC domain-containing protein [Paenibacillus roseipurpureus]|uniref:S-layer homology domain-containing protein n=1 Tax=Paenibacillus roseopurpureus TaxID=2918901 RepID=A0AA96LNK5_9BACL|nr:YcdB/YcdC domain-containing protein [Paenibacillus sp. MBLB1832]WNR44401.1 S-layer homology domain-containing protein [Paenibacillus sp. MBLB1832]